MTYASSTFVNKHSMFDAHSAMLAVMAPLNLQTSSLAFSLSQTVVHILHFYNRLSILPSRGI